MLDNTPGTVGGKKKNNKKCKFPHSKGRSKGRETVLVTKLVKILIEDNLKLAMKKEERRMMQLGHKRTIKSEADRLIIIPPF